MDLYVHVLQAHTKDQGLETQYDCMPFYPLRRKTKEDKRPKIRVIGYSQFQTERKENRFTVLSPLKALPWQQRRPLT